MKYIIRWKNNTSGNEGVVGMPFSNKSAAEEAARGLNKIHANIHHYVEEQNEIPVHRRE